MIKSQNRAGDFKFGKLKLIYYICKKSSAMSMIEYDGYIVKYTRYNEDGSITSFFDNVFDKKWKAKWWIWKCKRKADTREHYEIIDKTWK